MPVDLSIDGCGYWVYVDASNVKALNDLSTAKEQWKELDCGPIAACALGGYPAKPAHCAAEGQGGTTGFCTPD